MDKVTRLKEFTYAYSQMNLNEQEIFSLLVERLLKFNFLCKDHKNDREHYYNALRLRQELYAYISIMNIDFFVDEANGVIGITSKTNGGHLRLKISETIFLLCLRKLYYFKQQSVSLSKDIVVSIEEVRDELSHTGYFDKPMSKSEFESTLRIFKSYRIVDYSFTKRPEAIEIMPSILHVIKASTIDDIIGKIDIYRENMEVEDDEDFEEN